MKIVLIWGPLPSKVLVEIESKNSDYCFVKVPNANENSWEVEEALNELQKKLDLYRSNIIQAIILPVAFSKKLDASNRLDRLVSNFGSAALRSTIILLTSDGHDEDNYSFSDIEKMGIVQDIERMRADDKLMISWTVDWNSHDQNKSDELLKKVQDCQPFTHPFQGNHTAKSHEEQKKSAINTTVSQKPKRKSLIVRAFSYGTFGMGVLFFLIIWYRGPIARFLARMLGRFIYKKVVNSVKKDAVYLSDVVHQVQVV